MTLTATLTANFWSRSPRPSLRSLRGAKANWRSALRQSRRDVRQRGRREAAKDRAGWKRSKTSATAAVVRQLPLPMSRQGLLSLSRPLKMQVAPAHDAPNIAKTCKGIEPFDRTRLE